MQKRKKQVYSTMFRAVPHQTKEGTYRIQLTVGHDDVTGKRIIKSFTAQSPIEAVKMAENYLTGIKDEKENMTVGQAIDKYIDMKENILSPTTIRTYRCTRKNQMQSLMNVPLSKLTNEMIQTCFNIEAVKLSPKSLRNAKGLLSAALAVYKPDFTVRVTLPARQNKIKDLPEASEVIRAVKGDNIELPCLLAMWLSLRMSEIRGIRYSDISGNVLTIRTTMVNVNGKKILKENTKTFTSTRQLQIPAYIMNLIENQKKKVGGEFLVPLSGAAIYERFKRRLKSAGVKQMTFHDLRHLNASVMLMLGIPDKYAMERGGWSSTYTLKNVYQHTFSEKRKEVDRQIDEYFNNLITDNSRV